MPGILSEGSGRVAVPRCRFCLIYYAPSKSRIGRRGLRANDNRGSSSNRDITLRPALGAPGVRFLSSKIWRGDFNGATHFE